MEHRVLLTELTSGQTVFGSINPANDVDTYTFNIQAGDTVLLSYADRTSSPSFDVVVRVTHSSGTVVYENIPQEQSFVATLDDLLVGGEYTITLEDDDRSNTGDYSLSFVNVDAQTHTSGIVDEAGQTQILENGEGELDSGVSKNLNLLTGDIDVFTFEAQSGDTVALEYADGASPAGFNGFVQVFEPTGKLVFSDSGNNVSATIQPQLTGKFTVTIRDAQPISVADSQYELTVSGFSGPVADSLSLNLNPGTISENGGLSTATVSRTGSTNSAVTVNLSSSDISEATVPSSVVIQSGKSSATFTVAAKDDAIVDGSQNVTITASASGLTSGKAGLTVTDDDVAVQNLTLSLNPTTISENGGLSTATVSRTGSTNSAVTVSLSSSDISEATVSRSVVIQSGKSSATFTVTAKDDAIVDGSQNVTITASASGLTSGQAGLTVTDDDDNGSAQFQLNVGARSISENGGKAFSSVSRFGGSNASPLTVNLSSSDTSEATVPASVVIAAGENTAIFDVTGQDDAIFDGSQIVTITATASGFPSETAPLIVTDDENMTPRLSISLRQRTIGENGPNTIATIRRNGPTTDEITVTLGNSDPSEASFFSSVPIFAGEEAISFTVNGVDDSIIDGPQIVTITASSPGLMSASETFVVKDDDGVNPGAGRDILLFDSTSDTFRLATNTGNQFTWSSSGKQVSDSAFVGDFDGDGDLDGAIYNPNTSRVNVIENNGDGTLSAPITFGTASLGAPLSKFLGVADVNGDGTDELLYLREHPNTGNGPGQVRPGTQQIYVKFVAPGNAGERQLVTSDRSTAEPGTLATIEDFDGDGNDDVVFLSPAVTGGSTNVIPFYSVNNGKNMTAALSSGKFNATNLANLASVDLNTDGRADLVFQNSAGSVFTSTTTGNTNANNGNYVNFVTVNRGPAFSLGGNSQLLTGQFTNDGRVDIFAGNRTNGNLQVGVNRSIDGVLNPITFSNPAEIFGNDPNGLLYVAGDFNGDAFDDIVGLGSSAIVFATNGNDSFSGGMNFGSIAGGPIGSIGAVGVG